MPKKILLHDESFQNNPNNGNKIVSKLKQDSNCGRLSHSSIHRGQIKYIKDTKPLGNHEKKLKNLN